MVRDLGALFHERLGRLPKPRHVGITRPLRISLQPQRLLLVVGARTGPQLGLVLPPVVVCGAVRRLAFQLRVKIEEGLGNGELRLDLVDADAVVYQREKTRGFGGVDELLGDLISSVVEV